MRKIFCTDDVRTHERFDSWHAAAREYVIDHDSHPDSRLTFEAKLCAAALDEVRLVFFECSPMVVTHTSRHIGQATSDDLLVCRQFTGGLWLRQAGREVFLGPGDMTLLDPRLPYDGRFSSDMSLLVVKVPRRGVEARVGRTQGLVARPMKSGCGGSGLVSQFLGLLPIHVEKLGTAAATVASQTLDLLGMALTHLSGASGPAGSNVRFATLNRLRSVIERGLSDPGLSPATVAAGTGVSVRYANALLAAENTSIRRLILTRRLERCRQTLSDPSQAHLSISTIAYRWGFSDMTHFGRRFRAAYGLLPSEYRRSVCGCPNR